MQWASIYLPIALTGCVKNSSILPSECVSAKQGMDLTSTAGVAWVSSSEKFSGTWLEEIVTRLLSDWWLWWLCRLLICPLSRVGDDDGDALW